MVFNPRWADYVDIESTEFFRALGFGEGLAGGAMATNVAPMLPPAPGLLVSEQLNTSEI